MKPLYSSLELLVMRSPRWLPNFTQRVGEMYKHMCAHILWVECRNPLLQISAVSMFKNVIKGLRNAIAKKPIIIYPMGHNKAAYKRNSIL